MYLVVYRIKKKCSGNYRRFYTILKPMVIIFKTKEKAEEKMLDIKEWAKNSNGFYKIDYIEMKECKHKEKGIEFDKVYLESEVEQ